MKLEIWDMKLKEKQIEEANIKDLTEEIKNFPKPTAKDDGVG